MDAMLELFVCIENDEKKQTSAELLVQKALSIIKECYSDGIIWRKQPGDCMLPNSIWVHS